MSKKEEEKEEEIITPKDVMTEITELRGEVDTFLKGWVECPTCEIKVKVKGGKAICPVCKAVWDGESWLKPEKERKDDKAEGKARRFLNW